MKLSKNITKFDNKITQQNDKNTTLTEFLLRKTGNIQFGKKCD